MSIQARRSSSLRRRGAVAAITAVCGTVMVGFVALTVDVGMLYNVRAEMQRTADAAALAGAWEILAQRQLTASDQEVMEKAREQARLYAGLNPVQRRSLLVDENHANAMDGDVVLGYLQNPTNLQSGLDTGVEPSLFNTVLVRVRRNEIRNGPVDLWFARLFGLNSTGLEIAAAASFRDGVVGFRVTSQTGNANVLPFALHVEKWQELRDGTWTTGDNFRYDPVSKTVVSGSDGILELNLYPGGGLHEAPPNNPLPPGNFGIVNIGGFSNSTSRVKRQILEGLNSEDMAFHGGELKLGPDGTLDLGGDPGLSAAVADELEQINGQTRTIPLFDDVSGPGNNATFRIVGFAGIRVMEVELTGSMSQKRLIIQPAVVADPTAIVDDDSNSSYLVYQPVRLTR